MLSSEKLSGGSSGGGFWGAVVGSAAGWVGLAAGVSRAGERVDAGAPEAVGTCMMSLVSE